MLRTHQITGLGPIAADGSQKLFTVMTTPLIVSAVWLAAQFRAPQVGDDIVDDGVNLTLAITDAEQLQLNSGTAPQAPANDTTPNPPAVPVEAQTDTPSPTPPLDPTGSTTALGAAQAAPTLTVTSGVDPATQKKTDGSTDGSSSSATGSSPSPLPSYTANPVIVQAGKIVSMDVDGITLENGQVLPLTDEDSNHIPVVGDYWVTDASYEWFVPAALFVENFSPRV